MSKKSKIPVRSKLVKKLDIVFSKYVRLSNADKNGNCTCVTCNNTFYWKEIQAGHFMSRKHYSIRWDERNVKPQCLAPTSSRTRTARCSRGRPLVPRRTRRQVPDCRE